MHDEKGKRRNLRRAFLGNHRPKARALFKAMNPNYDEANWLDCRIEHPWWDICNQKEDEWIRHYFGVTWDWQMQNVNGWYRRDLNKMTRTRQKAALRRAFIRDEWDDFQLPPHRRNASSLWW